MNLLKRAWRAYWKSRPHPIRRVSQGLEIDRLRKQGLSNAEIIERIES